MIPLSLAEVADLCRGRLEAAPGAETITGLEIDSRRIGPGDLFVAIRGGVDHLPDALARGAAAALVPDDPHAAMAALGKAVRDRSGARVVGITGSTGKTSTKDILAALCRPHLRTVAAEQSHNNEIGLPLTLTRIAEDTELVIAEMGTRGAGQVAALCADRPSGHRRHHAHRARAPRAVRHDRGGRGGRGGDRRRAAGRRRGRRAGRRALARAAPHP